ncbi:MAG: hypothetical protein UY96_C0003G0009 [Parcubacteria group bacterium GW2011_GWB1_56_8]|nr:MAG: hypothetical protein UY96_C0003G0009 [Parcubacteria group bacterium GW2011_GWB1_56_8]
MIFPILLIAAGATAIIALAFTDDDGPVPNYLPDLPPMSGSTRYKKVDAILGELKKASETSGIPLGLLVGWVAKESGGRLSEVPKPLKGEPDGERGYFQLTPSESRSLGLDHKRLSEDPIYSINAGLLLIGRYMKAVDALGVAVPGSMYYWLLVKLAHTMGSGAMKIIVNGAKAAGAARTWDALERHALDNEARYFSATKHSPSKWFPLVDKVREVGQPFGFGDRDVVVGGEVFRDIVDPLDCLT